MDFVKATVLVPDGEVTAIVRAGGSNSFAAR
jgi:hypothetical protein